MNQRAPAWQMALPFIALAPMVAVENGSLISLPIVALCLIFVKTSRRPTLAFCGPNLAKEVVLGIGVGVGIWLFSHFVLDPTLERFLGRIDLDSVAAVKGNLANYFILLALGIVYGGVLEEVLNRGFVIGWGMELFGERAAVPLMLLSTVAFGIAHRYQDTAGMISTGVSGLVFGITYLAAGRKLMPAMLAHAISNAIGVTSLYLGYSG